MFAILAQNADSSSIMFATYDHCTESGTLHLVGRWRIALVEDGVEFRVLDQYGAVLVLTCSPSLDRSFDQDTPLGYLFALLVAHRGGLTLCAVGHRVVQGGQDFVEPMQVSVDVLENLEGLCPLAPLHQSRKLRAIRILRKMLPQVPQVACFDNAFHHTQPAIAQEFALPETLTATGVRRFRFHGLSYE